MFNPQLSIITINNFNSSEIRGKTALTLQIRLESVSVDQLQHLALKLGITPIPPSKDDLISKINASVVGLSSEDQKFLLLDSTDNRLLFSTPVPVLEVREHLFSWLKDAGLNETEIEVVDEDKYRWAEKQGIEMEQGTEYWNEVQGCLDIDRYWPDWLEYGDYCHIRAKLGPITFQAEMVPFENVKATALLIRLSGQPPFLSTADSLRRFLSGKSYHLVDDRPPCAIELSRNPAGTAYFRVDPQNSSRSIPFLEVPKLLDEALTAAAQAAAPEQLVQRTLLMFQLHSLTDHTISLFFSNLLEKCAVLPLPVVKRLAKGGTLGPKIKLLHEDLATLNDQEFEAAMKANSIRNNLYHANNTLRTQYVEYEKWYVKPETLLLAPAPRPGDMKGFIAGVTALTSAIGLGRRSQSSIGSSFYRSPSKVINGTGVFAAERYLACKPVNQILGNTVGSDLYLLSTVCHNCGMRMCGHEIARCVLCCPKCGLQSAILHPQYPCGHAHHPLFGIYRVLIERCLFEADREASVGNFNYAIQVCRLAFTASVSAKWLEGRNYFDEVNRLCDYGVCLSPDISSILSLYPGITAGGRAQGIQVMNEIEAYNPLSDYFSTPKSESDYLAVRELLNRTTLELDTKSLPPL